MHQANTTVSYLCSSLHYTLCIWEVKISPRCLLGSLFSRQGSSFPDGALILAVRELRSVSAIFRDTSAAVPTFSWDVLVMESSP